MSKYTNFYTVTCPVASDYLSKWGSAMSRCETCGNEYIRSFTVVVDGHAHEFDSFECAIHALAPTCGRCGIRIVGHGVESGVHMYCSANCAREAGAHGLVDHI